jgi:hypothetical protein
VGDNSPGERRVKGVSGYECGVGAVVCRGEVVVREAETMTKPGPRSLGARAREHCLRLYSWDAMEEPLNSVVQPALEGKRRSRS